MSVWGADLAEWTFTSESYPANKTDFAATDGAFKAGSTFYLNGTGSTWNTTKGYAFTAVTDITITLKLAKAVEAGTEITFAADMYYNKASNAPMTGFDMSVSVNGGAAGTTGLDVTSLALSNSSANKQVVYTTQTDLAANSTVALIYTQKGKAGAGQGYFSNVSITANITLDESTCTTPTFSPVAGEVVSGTEVTISCATDGATIHYTTDGSTPTASSPTYSSAITINEEKTIKAIAVKAGLTNSDVASASYTIVTPYTSIANLADAMTNSDQSVYVTFGGWQVSVVKNSQAFVTDGTNGLIIYQSGHGLVEGNILTGTVQCTLVSYNGVVELKGVTKTMDGIAVTSGTISPVVKSIAEANDLTALNTGLLIKLENVTYNGTAFVDAGSNTIAPYNTFYSYSLTSGQKYNVTGIVQQYQSNSQIYPRKAEDIEALTTIATPTFSPAAGEYTEIQTVTISCTTDGATVYYTTDGTNPTNESTVYSSAIEVGASMTIKAIAYKGEDHSEIATAAYTINIPIPSHDFQITHKFETGEGFEFPADWDGNYEGHEISYTDDKVVFASANKQSSGQAIDDCPVTKGQAISLVLTNSTKLISAVRFDYKQWGTKTSTLTMKYSTDGGANYSDFEPALTATNFAIQALSLPAGVNAIQVTGTSGNQIGLTSIAFDLANKPVVTKTVTITTPSNGTLVVKNAGVAIENGEAIEVGTTLTIEATPNTGYSLSSISVKDEDEGDVEINEGAFVLPSKNVTVSATFVEDVRPDASLILSVQGIESPYAGSYKVDDVVTLPNTATTCEGHVFAGWSEVEIVTPGEKPATKYYDKGESYTLSATTQTLYAVYADGTDAAWQITDGDLVLNDPSASSSYAKYAGDQMKDGKTFNITDVMPGTGGNAGKLQIRASSGTIYNKTAMSNDIASIEIDGVDLAVYESNEMISSQPEGDAITKTDGVYPFSNGNRFFFIKKTTSGAGYAASITVNLKQELSNYTTTCVAPIVIPEPEFDVAEGTYQAEQLVLIDNYDGNYIYVYTTDDSEPTLDSNLDPEGTSVVYDNNAGIEINASCTLKARAYDADGNYSDVTSAAYTINLPLTTIPAIFGAATSTQTEVNISMGNWVVSGVGLDGKTVYVTDGTNGFIIYNDEHGFKVGDVLSGTITCGLKKYKGAAELIGVTASTTGLSVATGGTISPAAVAPADLAGVNTGALISLSSWKYEGSNLTNGTTEIQPFTTLYAYGEAFTENKYYNVTGIYLQFDSKKEILPRDADDIDELTQEAPTMTWYTSDAKTATIAANATYTIDLGASFAPVFETNSTGALTYSSSDPTIAEINETTGALTLKGVTGTTFIKCEVAAAGDYTAGEQGFTLRVREAVAGENVVIVAQYDGKWYAMKNTFTGTKTAEAIEVTYADGKIWDLPTTDQEAITWVRTVDEGNVTFQVSNGDYLKTSGNDLALGAGESGNYQWNWNSTYYRTGEQARTFMYRESVTGFRSYAVSNAETSDYSALPVVTAAVFATTPEVIRGDLSAGKWGTICPKQTVENVEGATFYQITYLEEQNNLPYNVVFDQIEGTTLTAGKPYFFIAEGEEIRGIKTGDAVTSGSNVNGFYGYIGASPLALPNIHTEYTPGEDNTFVIHNNSVFRINSATNLKSERCYININATEPTRTPSSASPVRRRIVMGVQNTNAATGMEELNTSEAPRKMIIDGKMYIFRGEKMYNANGILVK